MAIVNYSDYESRQTKSTAPKNDFKVGYFNSLKDNGDEAIVRFAYESPKDFEVVTVHRVLVGEFYRSISCLKEDGDPVEKCPLCASGENKQLSKVYIKLLDYTYDETGKVVATPKVWERPALMISEIINAYVTAIDQGLILPTSKISDVIFKIRRDGVKGSRDTKYRVMAANPNMYSPEVYVKDLSAFEGFTAAHHSYMVKTAEEISTFLTTGAFPVKEKKTTTGTESVSTPAATVGTYAQPAATPVAQPVRATTPAADTFSQTNGSVRPHRYAL